MLAAAVVLSTSAASAGVPNPERSSLAITGQGSACQFRFRADGGLDDMTVRITVRDSFDSPRANCSTGVALSPNQATLALGSCGPLSLAGHTDADGAIQFAFSQIGGRGSFDVRATIFYAGARLEFVPIPVAFTSPDLDANGTVNVVDLGLWANGLPPGYAQPSDYDCNQAVNVIDLGMWVGGLGLGCNAAAGR